MSELHAALDSPTARPGLDPFTTHPGVEAPPAAIALPCPLPSRSPTEPRELAEFREHASDDKALMRLRRKFRDAGDWRSLANVLVLHAAAIESEPEQRHKAAELAFQAYELLLDRVKDGRAAAHALARVVRLRPEDDRAIDRLCKLYEALEDHHDLALLLRFRLRLAPHAADAPTLHLALAELLDRKFFALAEAVSHYEQALAQAPRFETVETLLGIYLRGGAWQPALVLIERVQGDLDPDQDRPRVGALHRQRAAIEVAFRRDIGAAARLLQAALKLASDDLDALAGLGALYLTSGKLTDDGVSKAADLFFKAAELARRQGERSRALKLLRRCLGLRPGHRPAALALESILVLGEDWLALDDLYRGWLQNVDGADAVPILLRRAELLETHLHRRDDARRLYEAASHHQGLNEPSWKRLEQLHLAADDDVGLAAVLDRASEERPHEISSATLLRAAKLYRDELGLEERAAVYFYKLLEREPFNAEAFEGYKEHWRRKHNWTHLRDLILYQIEQAEARDGDSPLRDPAFVQEFVELADVCERRLGDIDQAVDVWRRLAAVHPQDERPLKNIERIEKRARMWDNMVRVQEAELERTDEPEKRLEILRRLTQVYRDRQVNPERAIALHHEILALSPDDVQATRALTALYDRLGDAARVVELLSSQLERSQSSTEKVALLRRMAELCHHELDEPERAIWACQTLLELVPADRDTQLRLQQIYEEQGQWAPLHHLLTAELEKTTKAGPRGKLLHRMARIAELELRDDAEAIHVLGELGRLRPGDLDITDRIAALHERRGDHDALARLLGKLAAAPETPHVRKLDALLRLGHLAETHLHDDALTRSSFESVLRSRPDHPGALEALVRLYRRLDAWPALTATLGKLQDLADTDENAFAIARERAEILRERLGDPAGAAQVLEAASVVPLALRREIAWTLLALYQQSGQHQKVVREAETLLLAAHEHHERRELYVILRDTWQQQLGDVHAALSVFSRYARETPDDLPALLTLAELELEAGKPEAALETLARRLGVATDLRSKTATLERMAEIAETRLGEPERGLAYLRRALTLDPFAPELFAAARALAERHAAWETLIAIHEDRHGAYQAVGDASGRVRVCIEAADLAERIAPDGVRAFAWIRRAYFIALTTDLDASELLARLERMAEAHALHASLLSVIEEEIEMRARQGEAPAVPRYRAAATLAEDRLQDGARAVELLQRAHHLLPEDDALAAELERVASRHGHWQAVIELEQGRLERAHTDAARFAACIAIARVHEHERGAPEQAFGWLQKATRDLRVSDPERSADAFARLLALSERHGLWALLCEHQLDRANAARERGDTAERLEALEAAARLFRERLGDPFAAIRVLAAGLRDDPRGERLLPPVRELAELIDRDPGPVKVGALARLAVLQRLTEIALTDDPEAAAMFLAERARVRELSLGETEAAMAEWIRVSWVAPGDAEAERELERLARAHRAWAPFLVFQAARLHGEEREAEPRRTIYETLAELYEGPLERPEYALRAWLAAWKLRPSLPDRTEVLSPEHARLWRLAERTGTYTTPPVPRDPLLWPEIALPELLDEAAWQSVRLSPGLLDEVPSPHAPKRVPKPSLASSELSPDDISTEIPTELLDPEPSQAPEAEELELDELELEPVEITEVVTRLAIAKPPAVNRPPPPPRTPDQGLPPLPRLTRPVLPVRPRVASGWEELALAYADVQTQSKQDKADAALVLARLWEQGARDVERAFVAHERALTWVPEQPDAIASLRVLAERHAATDRLTQAYEQLLGEMAMPDHSVAMGLRLAALYEANGDLDLALARYRGVLQIVPQHAQALSALCRIYEPRQQWEDYTLTYAALLEAERSTLEDDEIVARSMELARLSSDVLHRPEDAIERLSLLVRQYPARRPIHAALIDRLIETEQWQPAIEAMRTASEAAGDDDYRMDNLVRAAEIYEQKLHLPDRAITAWNDVLATREDPRALEKLQALTLATGRYDDALPVIERRLARLEREPSHDPAVRVELELARARAQQEGRGDEAAALRTLERLVAQAPENDEASRRLAETYRRQGRTGDAIAVLERRLEHVRGEDTRPLFLAIADILQHDASDPARAVLFVEQALAAFPSDLTLRQRRVALARLIDDPARLADALAQQDDPDAQLEAADLFRGPLRNWARALRLYSRVLAEAKAEPDDPEALRRLGAALDGLIWIRADEGDHAGALAFMEKQLAESEAKSIRAQILTEMGRLAYHTTRDAKLAAERYDAALQEDPSHARAKLGKAELRLDAGDISAAERLLVDAVDHLSLTQRYEGELVRALMALAHVLESSGRPGEAYRRLTTAARHAPGNLEIRAAIVNNRVMAGRYRDAVTAADQLEQQIGHGPLPRDVATVSRIFAAAAAAELHQDHREAALRRYRRASEVDRKNTDALRQVVTLSHEQGALAEAARAAALLFELGTQPGERAERALEAGMLFHEAAKVAAEEHGADDEAALRKSAFEHLRAGIALLEQLGQPLEDRARLEIAYRVSTEHDPGIALALLDALLRQPAITGPRRLELLLEGVELGLGHGELEHAERYAHAARELAPSASAAVLAQARVYEATGRVDRIEVLVERYFEAVSRPGHGDDDRGPQITLLLRLADLQASHPAKAQAALERAASLDPRALGLLERRRLQDLHRVTSTRGAAIVENATRLLELDPLDEASLRTLAEHHARAGRSHQAHTLFSLLALVAPGDPKMIDFMSTHVVALGDDSKLALTHAEATDENAGTDAGIPTALVAMWENGHGLLAELLPRLEVPPEARLSPLGTSVLSQVWSEALKRFGQGKVALARADRLDAALFAGSHETQPWITVHLNAPPVLVAHERALDCDDEGELRFALGRALACTSVSGLFGLGLERRVLANLVSATLLAFHPRHVRRKHHLRADDDSGRMAQELARKLPMRVSRQLGALFKEHEHQTFDSVTWRAALRRAGNRFGLVWSGDLGAAVRVLAGPTVDVRERVRQNPDLEDLLRYASSPAYVEARERAGVQVGAALV